MCPIEKAMPEDIDSVMDVAGKMKWILVCGTRPSVICVRSARWLPWDQWALGILEGQYWIHTSLPITLWNSLKDRLVQTFAQLKEDLTLWVWPYRLHQSNFHSLPWRSIHCSFFQQPQTSPEHLGGLDATAHTSAQCWNKLLTMVLYKISLCLVLFLPVW